MNQVTVRHESIWSSSNFECSYTNFVDSVQNTQLQRCNYQGNIWLWVAPPAGGWYKKANVIHVKFLSHFYFLQKKRFRFHVSYVIAYFRRHVCMKHRHFRWMYVWLLLVHFISRRMSLTDWWVMAIHHVCDWAESYIHRELNRNKILIVETLHKLSK